MGCNPGRCAIVQVVMLLAVATGAAALHFSGATGQRALIEDSLRAREPVVEDEVPAVFNVDNLGEMISIAQAVNIYNLQYEANPPQIIFLDAREADKFAQGHVERAYNVTPESFFDGTLTDDIEFWPKDAVIVVYCSGGDCDASHLVQTRLKQRAFTRVFIMQAGYPGWKDAGLPVEFGAPKQ